ncbi:MAG TPA: transglycosylase SLT domain-containing protein [Polyangia bacterium]
MLAPPAIEQLLARHAGTIPLTYLRALARHESGFNPQNVNPKSNATGLFQITSIALADFNRANGTKHTLADLAEPELATRVAVRHVGAVLQAYAVVPSLRGDWTNRRFLELVTFGWNSGHNAVVRLAKLLEQQGITGERITVDTVHQLAVKLKVPYLSEPSRLAWAKTVATTALTPAGARPNVAAVVPSLRPSPGTSSASAVTSALLAAVVAGLGILAFKALGDGQAGRVPA